MTGGGASSIEPLLDFNLRPMGARRNWKNVVNKQRYDATLQQHRDPTNKEDLGHDVTQALRRAINRQIANNDTLTDHATLHFTMQSNTFTEKEFKDGSERLDTYLQSLAAKLNSNEAFALDDSFTMEMTFIHTPGTGSGHGKRCKPSNAATTVSPKSLSSLSRTTTSCVALEPS